MAVYLVVATFQSIEISPSGFSFGVISDGYSELKVSVENAPPNICFLDLVDREKMNDIYNLVDVMFLPSFKELFPMTILEAMNCRLPILLRDIEVYEEILFGYYLKGDSVAGFMQVLDQLGRDRGYYNHWCDQSWLGHQFYSREQILAKWEEFYDMVYDSTRERKAKSMMPWKNGFEIKTGDKRDEDSETDERQNGYKKSGDRKDRRKKE